MSHDDIRAALEAATPRPWDCYRPHPNYGTYMVERVAPGHPCGTRGRGAATKQQHEHDHREGR